MTLAIITFFGLAYGSFINAYVLRTRSGQNISTDRSQCPDCQHVLSWLDLIPVLSWMYLRGKCRYCHNKISIQYPIVEIVTAAFFGLSAWFMPAPETVIEWVRLILILGITGQFIALALYDIKWRLLPNVMLAPLLVMVVLYQVFGAIAGLSVGEWLISPLIGAVSVFVIFYILHILAGGKLMGGGDVKLVFVLGLLLGGWPTLVAMIIAFNVAALISVGLIVTGVKSRKDTVPFGPFLLFGAWVALVAAADIIDWYLRISGVA